MVKQILCNEFRLEVGKFHLITKSGSVVTLTDLDHSALNTAVFEYERHMKHLINENEEKGGLDEIDLRDIEKENVCAQWLKDVVSL